MVLAAAMENDVDLALGFKARIGDIVEPKVIKACKLEQCFFEELCLIELF